MSVKVGPSTGLYPKRRFGSDFYYSENNQHIIINIIVYFLETSPSPFLTVIFRWLPLRLKPYFERDIHGPKFLTQELDPRFDFELIRDPTVRKVIDGMEELENILKDDRLDDGNDYIDEEVIDLYTPDFNENDEDSNIEEELNEAALMNTMVMDTNTNPVTINDKALLKGKNHEVQYTPNGYVHKLRYSTLNTREQRSGRGEKGKDPNYIY